VNDHVGHVVNLATAWKKSGKFAGVDADEIRSIAFIEADRLLREKFDPTISTATTFLSRFLPGRVEYRILRDSGMRKRPEGWLASQAIDPKAKNREPDPASVVDLADLLDAVQPDLREMMERIIEGVSIERLAIERIPPLSFDSPTELEERIEETRSDLLDILRHELGRLTR
jgi:hypothetical protein